MALLQRTAQLDKENYAAAGRSSTRRGSANVLMLLVEAMRPRQWLKNVLVFAGLVFSGSVLVWQSELRAWAVFVAFCLASGATYLLNDVADVEVDRHNPRTASRPIARGDLDPKVAIAAAVVASILALGLAFLVNWQSLATVGAYIVLQVTYSNGLKHLLFVDVIALATGFVLRALAGIVAIGADISSWLLLCTGLVALFLAFAKRRAEAVALGGSEQPRRAVLDGYSVGLLDELIAVVTPSTVVVYALYSVTGARTDAMLLTLPFVLYGIFRFLYLIHRDSARTEEPTSVILNDRPLLACAVLWGIAAGVIGYLSA